MPTKLIIRTKDGLKLPDALEKSVCAMASIDAVQIEYKKIESIDEWIKSSAQERIKSLTKAFQLLCRAKESEALAIYVEELEKSYLSQPLSDYLTRLDCLACQALSLNSIDFKKQLAIAENYVIATTEKPILATVTLENNEYIVQMEVPQSPFNQQMLSQFANIKSKQKFPDWYNEMNADEKHLFDYVISQNENFSVLSSKHRTVVGVANFLEHKFSVLNDEGAILYRRPDSLRSSIAASRDMEYTKRKLRIDIARQNYEHIIQQGYQKIIDNNKNKSFDEVVHLLQNAPILLQTLISPTLSENAIPGIVLPPDAGLYEDKLAAIKEIKSNGVPVKLGDTTKFIKPTHLFETNHSQNIARKFLSTNGVFDFSGTGQQLQELKKIANTMIDKPLALTQAINELSDLLTLSPEYKKQSKGRRRELHLAGIEEFIMSFLPNAISHGSCVSGKDRKGLEAMYADAIHLYWHTYGKIPKLNDGAIDRKNFCQIFAKLYITHHQHMSAGFNAPGANAIKAPDRYLPKDICDAINELMRGEITLSNEIADKNELNNIPYQIELNEIKRASYRLDTEVGLFKIYNKAYYDDSNRMVSIVRQLIEIIKSKKWDSEGFKFYGWTVPDGISLMRTSLTSLNGSVIHDSKSALVCLIQLSRQVSDREKFYNITQYSSKHFYWLVNKLQTGVIEDADIQYLDRFYNQFVPSEQTVSFKPGSR